MNNLAMALLDLGQIDEAHEIMIQAYEERRWQLGKKHPCSLWALCNLAKTKVRLGLVKDAEDMLVGRIAAAKRSVSENHLGVLMGCGELARVHLLQGQFEEAEKLCLDTVRRLEKWRGKEHPDCIYALWKTGTPLPAAEEDWKS